MGKISEKMKTLIAKCKCKLKKEETPKAEQKPEEQKG